MKPYLEDKEAVLAELGSSMTGLTEEEAAARLARDGHNKLKEGKKESLLKKFFGQLKDPMTIVLIAAALVSAVTAVYAHDSLADAAIILAVVLVNACLGVYQESKAEEAIAALQQVAAATAKVIRGGHQKTIHADEVVKGDLLVLEAGDAVPADARLVECASMKTQEAALTGESTDVDKLSAVLEPAANGEVPLGDRKNMVSIWVPPFPTAGATRWSPAPAWTRRWAPSPISWPRPRMRKRTCRSSSTSCPGSCPP